jgi:hypothetical protein
LTWHARVLNYLQEGGTLSLALFSLVLESESLQCSKMTHQACLHVSETRAPNCQVAQLLLPMNKITGERFVSAYIVIMCIAEVSKLKHTIEVNAVTLPIQVDELLPVKELAKCLLVSSKGDFAALETGVHQRRWEHASAVRFDGEVKGSHALFDCDCTRAQKSKLPDYVAQLGRQFSEASKLGQLLARDLLL